MIKTIRNRSVSGVYNVDVRYVQPGLSVTPSEMLDLSQHGVPISSQLDASKFYDGDNLPMNNLDPLDARGVDINDAWNMSMNAKKKIHKMYNDSKVGD